MRGRKIIFPGVSALSPVLMPRCLCFSSWQLGEGRVFPGNLNINSEFTPSSPFVSTLGGRISRVGGPCDEKEMEIWEQGWTKFKLVSSTKSNINWSDHYNFKFNVYTFSIKLVPHTRLTRVGGLCDARQGPGMENMWSAPISSAPPSSGHQKPHFISIH